MGDDERTDEDIATDRLSLVVMPGWLLEQVVSVLATSDAADPDGLGPGAASAEEVSWPEVGVVPDELLDSVPAGRRLEQLASDPELAPWLVRAIVVADASAPTGRRVVGHLGGHGPPDEDGMVEVGYTVLVSERGRGLATAAARAWFDWAHAHGARVARLSTVPDNGPSRAVAGKLGLVEIGAEWDEDDACWELVHEAPLPLTPPVTEQPPPPSTHRF